MKTSELAIRFFLFSRSFGLMFAAAPGEIIIALSPEFSSIKIKAAPV